MFHSIPQLNYTLTFLNTLCYAGTMRLVITWPDPNSKLEAIEPRVGQKRYTADIPYRWNVRAYFIDALIARGARD